MRSKNVTVVSWNGATKKLIEDLIEWGEMPAMRRVIENGKSGTLRSPLPSFDYPAWASFYTGVSPGKHGVFGFSDLQKGGARSENHVSWGSMKQKTLYKEVSETGESILSVFMPLAYPPHNVEGYTVSEALTRQSNNLCSPNSIKKLLKGDVNSPKPRQYFDKKNVDTEEKIDEFLDRQTESIKKTENVFKKIDKHYNSKLSLVHFYATDTVQHALWNYLDPSHTKFSENQSVRSKVVRFFESVDESVKNILNKKNGINIFLSGHGHTYCSKVFNLGKFLKHELSEPHSLGKKVKVLTCRIIRRLNKRGLLKNVLPSFVWNKIVKSSNAVSSEHKVLYINKNNVPEGFTSRVIRKLRNAKDTESEKKVFSHVQCVKDWYDTELFSKDVDILVLEPNKGYTVRTNCSGNSLFRSCDPGLDYLIGTHTRNAFWAMSGEGIDSAQELNVNITDMMPTILDYLSIEPSNNLDGESIF